MTDNFWKKTDRIFGLLPLAAIFAMLVVSANIEIKDEVGDENIYIFGLTAEQVEYHKSVGYNPRKFYEGNPDLKRVIDMIFSGYFSADRPDLFHPIIHPLLDDDPYMLLMDYAAYIACQDLVARTYRHPDKWTEMSILNVARIGKFSSDRTIREYAEEIWDAEPVVVGSV